MAESRHRVLDEYTYEGMTMSSSFPSEILDRVKEFKLHDEDVLLVSYPKAGVTWFQEIVWLLMNNIDLTTAKDVLQDIRVPFLEIDKGMVPLDIDILETMAPPRIIKTHLSYRFFEKQLREKKTKVVLGARNIKDTLVSMYHFYRMNASFGQMTGPFSEFFDLFKEKHLAYGDWFDFNLSYWNEHDHLNLFVLKYEDLQKDLSGTLKNLADFLSVHLSDEQLTDVMSHVGFDVMKTNEQVNKIHHPGFNHKVSPFMRKGKVGDWKEHLSEEQNEYVDEIYKQRIEGSGLVFDFEI